MKVKLGSFSQPDLSRLVSFFEVKKKVLFLAHGQMRNREDKKSLTPRN